MLHLVGEGGVVLSHPWSRGAARYEALVESNGSKLVVAVNCAIGEYPTRLLALLDTGAQWSMLPSEIAGRAGLGAGDEEISMRTRFGRITGHLHTASVTLLAEKGEDLAVEARVIVSDEWSGPIVLGYQGLLERVRIALDPGSTSADGQWLYFARAG